MIRRLLDRWGFADPATSPWPCKCGCPADFHVHYRTSYTTDCGACGVETCRFYRPNRHADPEDLDTEPIDMQAVCASNEMIDAINARDLDRARECTDHPEFVDLLLGWADGRHW